jgi:hypothetical protein
MFAICDILERCKKLPYPRTGLVGSICTRQTSASGSGNILYGSVKALDCFVVICIRLLSIQSKYSLIFLGVATEVYLSR